MKILWLTITHYSEWQRWLIYQPQHQWPRKGHPSQSKECANLADVMIVCRLLEEKRERKWNYDRIRTKLSLTLLKMHKPLDIRHSLIHRQISFRLGVLLCRISTKDFLLQPANWVVTAATLYVLLSEPPFIGGDQKHFSSQRKASWTEMLKCVLFKWWRKVGVLTAHTGWLLLIPSLVRAESTSVLILQS